MCCFTQEFASSGVRSEDVRSSGFRKTDVLRLPSFVEAS